ncbi:MAG: hypothetical protein RL023_381 [Candidatus Parcubacteria bacterium]|jgi:hypothetical protein
MGSVNPRKSKKSTITSEEESQKKIKKWIALIAKNSIYYLQIIIQRTREIRLYDCPATNLYDQVLIPTPIGERYRNYTPVFSRILSPQKVFFYLFFMLP